MTDEKETNINKNLDDKSIKKIIIPKRKRFMTINELTGMTIILLLAGTIILISSAISFEKGYLTGYDDAINNRTSMLVYEPIKLYKPIKRYSPIDYNKEYDDYNQSINTSSIFEKVSGITNNQ